MMESLTVLDLRETAITSAGLKELASCKNLTKLVLVNTMVSDAGMKELAALKRLSSLSLQVTKVGDKGSDILLLARTSHTSISPRDSVSDAGLMHPALKNLPCST